MSLEQRVRLQGLVQASYLNGQLGTVSLATVEYKAGAQRVTVHLDSGRSVSAKLENITWLASQTRSSSASSSSAVQLAGASAGGAATNGLGVSPFSLAPMPVADARAVSIPQMAWGSANPVSFLKHWARRIAVQDPLGVEQYGEDPHVYLVAKLFRTLSIIKKPNSYGQAFWAAGPSRCIPCFVCADGSPGQRTELGTPMSDPEIWWPCIVILEGNAFLVPFYCPALAWQHARPWDVHVSRLRCRGSLSLTTPSVLHSLTTPDSALPLDDGEWEVVDEE